MRRIQGNHSGFTLVELLVVVLIIGILAAAALPQYRETVMRSRLVEAAANMGALERAYSACVAGKRHASTAGCTAAELGVTVANDAQGWQYYVYEKPSSNCNGEGDSVITKQTRICAYHYGSASGGGEFPVLSASYTNGVWRHYCAAQDYVPNTAKLCRSLANAGYGTI